MLDGLSQKYGYLRLTSLYKERTAATLYSITGYNRNPQTHRHL